MSAEKWSLGEPADEQARRLLDQPFDVSSLSFVAAGSGGHCSWELHDGPHPLIQDPHAVAARLIVRHHGENAWSGWTDEVGAALADGEVANVGYSAGGLGADRHGHIEARCRRAVHAARVWFDDATSTTLTAAVSATTGQHWIICPLHDAIAPTHVDFLGDHGQALLTTTLQDPRRSLPQRHPRA